MHILYNVLNAPFTLSNCIRFSMLVLLSGIFFTIVAQPSIAWQKTIGTPRSDDALQLFQDDQGNFVMIGIEPHEDFTGHIREYMFISKYNPDGHEMWKEYHDVAFETFNPPVAYTVGSHFYTEEWGDTLINVVIHINNQTILYKMADRTGEYVTYEQIQSPIVDVERNNEKVYAWERCSVIQSCYGPDSLVVERFDPTPDSIIFNPIKWTFELKQNIRTSPIQGHYDFDVQDINVDSEGNVYLLVQIERWDFQFCTDCADAFVDAWCEVFKLNADGEWIGHKRLAVTTAVVSNMRFVAFDDNELVVQINDINAAETAVVSAVYTVNSELQVVRSIQLDRWYHTILQDETKDLVGITNIFDPGNAQIKGFTDVLVSGFDPDGTLQWNKYLGGSGYDFSRGIVLPAAGEIVFVARTDSKDFDVAESIGQEDIWLVKLSEETTSTDPDAPTTMISVYPNPCADYLYLHAEGPMHTAVYDVQGRAVLQQYVTHSGQHIDVSHLSPGVYGLHATDLSGTRHVRKWIKI